MKKLSILALLTMLIFVWSCDQGILPPPKSTYTLEGALVKNLDNDSIAVNARFNKNDTALASGLVTINMDTLRFDSTLFKKSYRMVTSLPAGNYSLVLADSNRFRDTVFFTIPDTLDIVTITPDTRLNPGGREIRISWLTSAGSNGYVFGVVLADSAYASPGYSQFVATGATSVTIPPDAFRSAGNLVTGWYYVYIYSFFGAPVLAGDMPTGFPVGLPANINTRNFSGSWGVIVVSPHDSMLVTVQP